MTMPNNQNGGPRQDRQSSDSLTSSVSGIQRQVHAHEREIGTVERPAPGNWSTVAAQLAEEWPEQILCWKGDSRHGWYAYTGAHWEERPAASINTRIRQELDRSYFLKPKRKAKDAPKDAPIEFEDVAWRPNIAKVGEVARALGEAVLPFYGEAQDVMALANGVLDITQAGQRILKEHDPKTFNLSSLPFAYDAEAEAPSWIRFLGEVLPGDAQAQELLQEWFGYVFSGRKDIHKMAALVGKPRSGKGTVAQVIQAMVGEKGWASPILGHLGGTFGLESLVGKKLAILGDVRWNAKDTQAAVPILLGLGSEDTMTVNRKNKTALETHMTTRVMMMSNDLPSFTDVSGALTGRLLILPFNESFEGREDLGLRGKLLGELPGILNWALDGLDRLNARGRFLEPKSAEEMREQMVAGASPVKTWAEEWCAVGDKETLVPLDVMYQNYKAWCLKEGREHPGDKARFSRDLHSAFGKGITERKTNKDGSKTMNVVGFKLDPQMRGVTPF